MAEVEPPPVGVVGADRDELAEPGERVHRPLERLTADVLDDHVDAALVRPLPRLLDEVLRAVVHDTLGAQRPGELDLVVGADGRDDAGAAETRDLDRRAPDTAAGRLDQHGLSRPDLGLRHERVPRGEHGQRHCGARLERDRLGRVRTFAAGTFTSSA